MGQMWVPAQHMDGQPVMPQSLLMDPLEYFFPFSTPCFSPWEKPEDFSPPPVVVEEGLTMRGASWWQHLTLGFSYLPWHVFHGLTRVLARKRHPANIHSPFSSH